MKLICKKNSNLICYLNEMEGLGYNKIQALIRKKDIRINGNKVKEDCKIFIGDVIELFAPNNFLFKYEIIYEDDNVVIVNKPKKLEVVSETKDISLINLINPNYYAVHRLDYNTEGLVVIAKNLESKKSLDEAIKNRKVDKQYVTICKNTPLLNEKTFKDYHIFNDGKAKISNKKLDGYSEIITKVETLKTKNNFSLLLVDLITGKSHQIRSHLAFHNLYVLGDEKYGDFNINKKLNLKNQILRAVKLTFHFDTNDILYNLNNKTFSVDYTDIQDYFESL